MKLATFFSLVLPAIGDASVSAFSPGFGGGGGSNIGIMMRVPSVVVGNHYFGSRSSIPVPFGSMATINSSASKKIRLRMAKSGDASNDESAKNRLVSGHQLCSALFLATTLGMLYNGIGSPIGFGLPLYAASGPYLAAGVSSILSDAAEHDRLGSDTYKRLALFLTEFNLCGVSTILLALGGTALGTHLFYSLSLASFLSLSPTLAGYKTGGGNVISEIGNIIKGFFTFKNLNALIYLTGTWFVASLKVLKLIEMINLYSEGNPAKVIVTRAVRFGRLALFTGVLFTLKDAANRDRLEGTTFVDLNFLSSIALGTMAFYTKTVQNCMTPLAWASAGFSAFTAMNGIVSVVKNSKR
mmetsp:Transcript_3124/g.8157  ORF Transcript_3124/g.8157 Transcript_3124/m.8157 type:complete len:355 (-) Transcript_3124:142-1206(-)